MKIKSHWGGGDHKLNQVFGVCVCGGGVSDVFLLSLTVIAQTPHIRTATANSIRYLRKKKPTQINKISTCIP